MEKDKKQLAPLRIVVAAYIILALAMFGVQFARVLKNSNKIEFTSMGVSLAAWVVVAICLFLLIRRGREYLKGFLAAGVGIVATALEIYMARRNLAAGMGNVYAYVDFFVIAFWFLAIVALLYTFAKILNGLAKDVAPYDQDLAYTYAGKWWLVGTIVLLMLFLIPVAGFFPKVPQLIATAVFGFIALGAQLYVCKLILDGYNTVAKAKPGRNRASGKGGNERTMMLTTEDLKKVREQLAAQEAAAHSKQESLAGTDGDAIVKKLSRKESTEAKRENAATATEDTSATGAKKTATKATKSGSAEAAEKTAVAAIASDAAGATEEAAKEGGWARFKRGMADKVAQRKEQRAQRAAHSEEEPAKQTETKQESREKAEEATIIAQQKAKEAQKAAEEAARLSGVSSGTAAAKAATGEPQGEGHLHGRLVESYDWTDPSKLAEEKVGIAPKNTREVPKIDADRFKREIHAFRQAEPQNQEGQPLRKEGPARQDAPQHSEGQPLRKESPARQNASQGQGQPAANIKPQGNEAAPLRQGQDVRNEDRADAIRQMADTGEASRPQNNRDEYNAQKREEPRRVPKVVEIPRKAERPQEKGPSRQ